MGCIILVPVYSQQLLIPYIEKPDVVVDGVISSGEYPVTFMDPTTGIDLSWVHSGSLLFIRLSCNKTGWLSIGFGSSDARMDGANIVIGSVNVDGALVVDEVGVGHAHFPDTSRGGDSNIIESGGMISDGVTIEFVIPLDSGDQLDYTLSPGESYGFFLAINDDETDFSKFHSSFSETYLLTVEAVPDESIQSDTSFNYLYLIVVLVSVAFYLYWRNSRPRVYRFSEMNT
jgi:hypothetical protein